MHAARTRVMCPLRKRRRWRVAAGCKPVSPGCGGFKSHLPHLEDAGWPTSLENWRGVNSAGGSTPPFSVVFALLVELVDTPVSETGARKGMGVRFPHRACGQGRGLVPTPGCGPGDHRFKSGCSPHLGHVAQLVERGPVKAVVGGSSPPVSFLTTPGGVPRARRRYSDVFPPKTPRP